MLLYDTLLCLKALVSSADSKQVYCLIDFSWYLLQSRHNYKRHSILESSKWLMSMVLENIRESNSSILSILLGQAFIFAERPLRAKCVMVTILVRFGNTKQKKTFAATFQFTIKRNAQSQYTHTQSMNGLEALMVIRCTNCPVYYRITKKRKSQKVGRRCS